MDTWDEGYFIGVPVRPTLRRQARVDRGDVPLAYSANELEQFIKGSRKHAAGWIGFYCGKPPEELRRSKEIGDALTPGRLDLFEKKAKALGK